MKGVERQEVGGSELSAYYLIQKLEERDITLENVVRKAPTTGWAPRPDEEETDGGYLAAAESDEAEYDGK